MAVLASVHWLGTHHNGSWLAGCKESVTLSQLDPLALRAIYLLNQLTIVKDYHPKELDPLARFALQL